MDKQHKLTKFFLITVFSLFVLILTFSNGGCRRADDANPISFIKNTTGYELYFKVRRASGFVLFDRDLPSYQKTEVFGGALHLSKPNIVFKTINENFGLATDTVEILHNGEVIIKWGGPLRVMEPSNNHFYNENSWHIEPSSGFRCRYEHATFTIYESDLPPKGGN